MCGHRSKRLLIFGNVCQYCIAMIWSAQPQPGLIKLHLTYCITDRLCSVYLEIISKEHKCQVVLYVSLSTRTIHGTSRWINVHVSYQRIVPRLKRSKAIFTSTTTDCNMQINVSKIWNCCVQKISMDFKSSYECVDLSQFE